MSRPNFDLASKFAGGPRPNPTPIQAIPIREQEQEQVQDTYQPKTLVEKVEQIKAEIAAEISKEPSMRNVTKIINLREELSNILK
jgi:hypothetical protein